jgi:uncharacterized repeat protein (TIGR01451 family)
VKSNAEIQAERSVFSKQLRVVLSGALIAMFAIGVSAPAMAAPEPGGVELRIEQLEEVVVKDKNGKEEKKLQPLTRAAPGTQVVYVMNYRNKGTKPADGVVLTNPVPKELVYVPGTSQGAGTRFDLSVDGGKTFGALEALKVAGEDGKPRPATAADVTTLRWAITAPLKPGAEGKVTYRALLK